MVVNYFDEEWGLWLDGRFLLKYWCPSPVEPYDIRAQLFHINSLEFIKFIESHKTMNMKNTKKTIRHANHARVMNSICKIAFMNEIRYHVRNEWEKMSGKSLEMTTCMSSLTMLKKPYHHQRMVHIHARIIVVARHKCQQKHTHCQTEFN